MHDIEHHMSPVRRACAVAVAGLCLGLLAFCSPESLIGNAALPDNISDPAVTKTPAGALAAYKGTLLQLRTALGDGRGYVATTGLLSDELMQADVLFGSQTEGEDIRILPEHRDPTTEISTPSAVNTYSQLQKIRGQASEALGLLHDYSPTTSPALRGHLFAVTAYTEVMLAELYCSGIPLSTLDYNGDYTLKPGSSTRDVLTHATALFDSALALSSDSARFLNLARVGKARALLDLGEVAEAAAAVADVPDGYRYDVSYNAAATANGVSSRNFAQDSVGTTWYLSVADVEGVNGLPYRTSGDPRTASTNSGQDQNGVTLYHPNKYAIDGSTSIVLADWVEARLIQAENALSGTGGSWLATLNELRTSGSFTTNPPDTEGHVDTLWSAGTAGVAGLRPLEDPGTPDARLNLLFQERAYWLFLTGHRQGDLRRLIHQYGRNQASVYPIGSRPGGLSTYGNDVTAPIPADERVANPQFTGCIDRGA